MSDDGMMPPPDVIEAMMKHCRCCTCCRNPPCDGVMAGGLCDRQGCVYEDEWDFDDHQRVLYGEDDDVSIALVAKGDASMKTPRELAHEHVKCDGKHGDGRWHYHRPDCDNWTAAIKARDAEVRAAALEEAAQVADSVADVAWREASTTATNIAERIRALAAPASTPKPPESADGWPTVKCSTCQGLRRFAEKCPICNGTIDAQQSKERDR